ncbi:hypothetical protein AGMMS49921_09830 [Endomicrobiia bacterium]|nr:hypothetical protein AGMMS49921_09830 [Endomicrobiia bacterium]
MSDSRTNLFEIKIKDSLAARTRKEIDMGNYVSLQQDNFKLCSCTITGKGNAD